MSISVLSHDRIPMSQKERDVLKIMHAVSNRCGQMRSLRCSSPSVLARGEETRWSLVSLRVK
jgi:hypothetical protein